MKKTNKTITGNGRPIFVNEKQISFAPWNPRPEITEDDVAELSASIREKGLLNRLSVMAVKSEADDKPSFVVFAGNRRLAACRLAGLKEIPCELFDVTVEEAKVLTALENLQRKDVEPIREAALVEECLRGGMTGEEIAAKVGKSNAWVTRRRKLLSLDQKFREAAEAHPDKIATDALENIALYPAEIQRKLSKDILSRLTYSSIRWSDISTTFARELRDLDNANFIRCPKCGSRELCESCERRTGAQGDLFGEVADGQLGRCLDGKCFADMQAQWRKAMVDDAVPKGTEVVYVKYPWEFPKEATGKKQTKKNPCAYVLFDDARLDVRFGPSAEALREAKAREADERRTRELERSTARQIRDSIAEKILSVTADQLMECDAFFNILEKGLGKEEARIIADALEYYIGDHCRYNHKELHRVASGLACVRELSGVSSKDLEVLGSSEE